MLEPSALYIKKENGIAEYIGQILIERMRCIIIRRKILDNLWPEILLAIIHITNLLSILSFKDQSPFETSFKHRPNLEQLCILGSTVYIFIYQEEQKAKSTKWAF